MRDWMRGIARTVIVLAVVGTLVSAQQARAESVFTDCVRSGVPRLTLPRVLLASAGSSAGRASALEFLALRADTVETADVEVEEEKGSGIGKEIAVFAIIGAAVGYAVFVLMRGDDESTKTSKPGKPGPVFPALARFAVPLTR